MTAVSAAARRRRAPCSRWRRSACSWRSSTRRSSTSPSPTSGGRSRTRASATLSWVLSAYNIVFAAFLVPAGGIADLLGRKRAFLFGLVVFTVASALCAIAPSAEALIGFRVLQAIGAAFLVPASLGLVLEAFPAERRAHAVALIQRRRRACGRHRPVARRPARGASTTGGWCSSSTCRSASPPTCWRAATWSRAARPAAGACPTCRRAAVRHLGCALVLGVIKGEDWGWTSAKRARLLRSSSIALGLLFVWRCTWHRSPVLDLSTAGSCAPSRCRTR